MKRINLNEVNEVNDQMAYGEMKDNLLINGNIPKSYFRLTIPNVLSMVITLVYNLADT